MIKRMLLSLCFLLGLSSAVMAMEIPEAGKTFDQAVQAYKDGRFDEAVSLNEKILAGKLENEAVYYNLGNAYFKNKQLGKAIVNYLCAQTIAPRDADLSANLAFARNIVENYQPFAVKNNLTMVLPLKKFSVIELKWLSLIFFMLIGCFVLAGLYWRFRAKRLIQGMVFLALIWCHVTAALFVKVIRNVGLAVAVEASEAKFEPSAAATTYFKLPEGTEVHVLRDRDGWVKIERPDGKIGWVAVGSIEKVSR